MRRRAPLLCVPILCMPIVFTACHPQQPVYLHEDGDLSHYLGMATDLDVPDLEDESLGDVEGAIRPFSLENNEPVEVWDLTLEEAVYNALTNSKVMRSIGGQIQGPPDFIVRNPEMAPTVYDPAITESNPRLGVEAALSAFDAQLTSSLFWEKFDTPRNIGFDFIGSQRDTGSFQTQISKTAATGGTFSLRHNVEHETSDSSIRLVPGDWNVNLQAEFRQPILQGAGVQFNRIAGPGAIPGFNNGVMIARINTDVALADFEAGVRNLVSDVEVAYWELYFSYRNLDAVVAGRDSALQTWRRVYALFRAGARGGEAEKEAQAREQYFLFRSAVEESLNALYAGESKLRYMMGLAATDGRLIRPADEPTTAKVSFDWYEALGESLCRNVELRQQKWIVKRRELELIAAKNYLLPRLDAVGNYRWLGLGEKMIESSGGHGAPPLLGSNAYQTMTDGKFQEWQFGLEFSLPIGFRKEMAGVRHAQLNLARERARLQEQELELSHQLAHAVRELEAKQVLSQTNFNRRVAAQRQVDAVAAAYETETVTLDLLLDAQRRLAQAESDYYRSLVDYNKSIADVHFRKGSLLEYNGVQLSEGPWPGKAYFDAHGRARARDASFYLDYGFTRPKVISRGAYDQQAGGQPMLFDGEMGEVEYSEGTPEMIPTPAPEPPGAPIGMPDEPVEPPFSEPFADPQVSAPKGPAVGAVARKLAAKKNAAMRAIRPLEVDSTRSDQGTRSTIRQANFIEPVARPIISRRKETAAGRKAEQPSTEKRQWTSSKSTTSTRHESIANPPAAESDQPASGWKGIQR